MYVKSADTCPFVFDFVHDQYKTQELRDKVVSKDPFMLRYCPNRYKAQRCVIKLLMLLC